jgi:hypothetical protein
MLEQGLIPELFNEIMMNASKMEGRDRDETISRIMQIFGVKNYNAAVLTDQWTKMTNNGAEAVSSESTQALIDKYGKTPPPPNNPEFDAAKQIEEIKNILTETGQSYWNKQMEKLPEDVAKAIREGRDAASKVSGQKVNYLMSGFGDMPVYNTPSGVPTLSFNDRMEEARLASVDTLLRQAYTGIQEHFTGLSASEQNNAAKSGYYSSIWHESQGDLVKMWEIIQRNINTKPVDMDAAVQGFFDKRDNKHSGAWLRTGDYEAIDNLDNLRRNTKVDSPDYEHLMRAFRQLSAFNDSQRETVDRNNSLNAILQNNQLTAQKLYDAVVELSRKMGVNVVFEECP